MKNAILQPVSSQLCSYGNSEPVWDIPMQMDSKQNVFCTDQKVHNEYNYQYRDGGFAVPPHESTIINYQPGPSSLTTMETLNYPYLGSDYNLTTASSHDNIHQQSLSFCNNLSILQYDIDFQGIDARKRPIQEKDRGSNSNVVGREWTTNKKKAVCFQEQWHHQLKEELKEIQRDRVPVRRSQKLSDKITALQKLVSPYGKTDTASVLQEASISIKVLQDQIQNLFRMLSASYTSSKPLDLQTKME
ncbi:unnamed protein product [Camellia sinensis]